MTETFNLDFAIKTQPITIGHNLMATLPITLADGQSRAVNRIDGGTLERTVLPAKIAGLAIATVMPAAFWTLVFWAIGRAFGYEVETTTLISIATSITIFLGFVCSAILNTN